MVLGISRNPQIRYTWHKLLQLGKPWKIQIHQLERVATRLFATGCGELNDQTPRLYNPYRSVPTRVLKTSLGSETRRHPVVPNLRYDWTRRFGTYITVSNTSPYRT